MREPLIIQGGMGAGVSSWKLAKAVSQAGQLGVVSGTALENILSRRLQMGDLDGSVRRALSFFPDPAVTWRVLNRYFIPRGKDRNVPFKNPPMFTQKPSQELLELTIAANFVEVFLAKEGHSGAVGINYLEKIQLPTLPSLYGALLAGVDYVLMGAGIPRAIPGILDQLALSQEVSLKLNVQGAGTEDSYLIQFDPRSILGVRVPTLRRPKFLAIVASEVLAATLAKKSSGRVDGFVVEGPTAGGHNAPPRGTAQFNEKGEPLYGPKDEVDPAAIQKLGLPFWLAGSYGDPEKLKEAIELGATGVQVGTLFAYCEESGLTDELKKRVFDRVLEDRAEVFTDPVASPTGFPFKVVQLEGTQSEKSVYEGRTRICDLGYLRSLFKRKDGSLGYRCPGEPVGTYFQKEGKVEDTPGRKCLCNSLLANVGLAQTQRDGRVERPLLTSGDELGKIAQFLKSGKLSYSAEEVIQYLLAALPKGFVPLWV